MFYEVMVAGAGGSGGIFTYGYDKAALKDGGENGIGGKVASKSGGGDNGEVSKSNGGSNGGGDAGAPDSPAVGQIVEVPLRNEMVMGVVVKKVVQPDFKTKPIERIIYTTPLPEHLVKAAEFMVDYYQAPVGACAGLIIPKGAGVRRRTNGGKTEQSRTKPNDEKINSDACLVDLKSLDTCLNSDDVAGEPTDGDRGKRSAGGADGDKNPQIRLNPHQKNALEALLKAPGATKLLHGVTGSGKTNIYLTLAARALKAQKSVILLVPEIALTGQLTQVFQDVFHEKVRVMHSKLTDRERRQLFEELLETDEPQIVIGARSALFMPLHNLGLIIVDEEHEATYCQEKSPKYSAIRVASYMAKTLGRSCILGSATPTVADYYLAAHNNAVVTMTERAKKGAKKAEIKVIDFKNRDEFSKNRYFSNSLLAAIKRNLEKGHQTLIFHNRRGSAPLTLCENCGNEFLCPKCYLPMTLHADDYVLQCHTCGHSYAVPPGCPKCGSPDIVHKGFGTKLLENELARLFPKARVARFDADNRKGESLDAMYTKVRDGEVDILVGTQTLAKGLDLPLLATVGVVQADAGLSLPDFAAEERAFQLLTQVIGRVGRGHLMTAEVFIQTFRPDHPVIRYAVAEDYRGFYGYTLKVRQKGHFPPFTYVARCELTSKNEATAIRKTRVACGLLVADDQLIVSPPMPAFHEHTEQGYNWGMVVRARSRKALVEAMAKLPDGWRVTLDPPSLL